MRGGAEAPLLLEIVHLDHHAVGVVVERVAVGLEADGSTPATSSSVRARSERGLTGKPLRRSASSRSHCEWKPGGSSTLTW